MTYIGSRQLEIERLIVVCLAVAEAKAHIQSRRAA